MKLIDDPTFLINGAFGYGKLLGYAYSFLRKTPAAGLKLARKFVMIDGIVVDKNSKRMGIGKKLFEHVNEFAKENSGIESQLQVYAFNKSAHDFYEELGFSDMAMIMCKNIT